MLAVYRHMAASSTPGTSSDSAITLVEADIEGATLDEPLEAKTVPQLRWWLLCHGIESPTEKKAAVIERLVYTL